MSVKALPDVKVAIQSQFQTLGLDFNTSHPPLDDVRVRRAFAYAIDKQALVDRFTGGTARSPGPTSRRTPGPTNPT